MNSSSGIILRTDKYKESSKIVYILTNSGKKSFIAKNANNFKAKNYSYTLELSKIDFNYVKSTGKSFDILTTGNIVNSYINIKNDYNKMVDVINILNSTFKYSDFVCDYENFYLLLDFCLDNINLYDKYKYYVLIFKLKLLYLLGIGPNFSYCNNCESKENLTFSIPDGGAICSNCNPICDKYNYFNYMKIMYVTKFNNISYELLENIPYESLNDIDNIVNEYYKYHLELDIK